MSGAKTRYSTGTVNYAGKIDFNLSHAEQLENTTRTLEEGFWSIKMRVGRPSFQKDVERVAAVCEHIGPEIELMVDANEAWRTDQALRAMHALREFDLN